jgi:drug/metabolite transporter (DMT)-like permease
VRRPAVGIAVLASIWGGSYLFNEIALRELDPGAIVWSRVTLGALVVWPLAIASGATGDLRRYLGPLVITGLVQIAAPITLITVGQQWIASSLAGVLNGSVPIFVALFALVLDRSERPTGWRVAGIALGFAGVVAVYGLDVGTDRYALLGAVCLTLSSVGYAIGPLYAKSRIGDVEPLAIVAVLLTVASIATLPLALASPPHAVPGPETLAAIAMGGIVGTGLAFALYYRIMLRIGPSRTSVVAYLIPAVAVLYGAVLLSEPVGNGIAIGLVLILAGSYLTARRARVPA